MVRCSTQHLMTVLYVSGMFVDSSRYHLRHADQQPSAAYRASLATRWPVQPQCPCSQPEYLERGGQSLGLAFPSGLPLQAGSAASLLLVLMSYAARPSLLRKWDFLQEPLTSICQTPPEGLKYMSKCSTFFVWFPFGGQLACHICAIPGPGYLPSG